MSSESINKPGPVLVSIFSERQVIMQRELLTPGLPLVECGHGEGLLAGDEGGEPDHPRLVAHDEAARPVLVDAPPGRLGQVGGGEDEEGDGGVRGVRPGVGLDVRRGSSPEAGVSSPVVKVILTQEVTMTMTQPHLK